jgi:Flagellar protein YcgR/PilZ domain
MVMNDTPLSAPQPLQPAELPVGQPLPCALVDLHGEPLLAAGAILPDEASRDFLFAHFSVHRAQAQRIEVQDEPQAVQAAPDTSKLTLDNMKLKIGAQLRIRPPAQTGFGVVVSHLIGFAPNQSLFVTQPRDSSHDVRLIFGERLEILHVGQRAVFDFVCTVDAACKIPFDYLVLSAPAHIRRLRARNATRMHLMRPVLYRTGPSDQPLLPGPCTGLSMMLDLSAQGLSLLAPQALAEVGEHMRVAFQFQTDGATLGVDAPVAVRNLRPQREKAPGSAHQMIHGLEFRELDAPTRLALRCMVLERSLI